MKSPRYERDRRQNQRLVAFECQDCGWVSFPERRQCCKRCATAPADFQEVQLTERGIVRTYVIQKYLPDAFEDPQPLAIVDIPQAEGDGESARVYGILTETDPEELAIGAEVEARFRELFTDGDRPINSFKFKRAEDDTP
jgi:uncharacterized OB-fold protein